MVVLLTVSPRNAISFCAAGLDRLRMRAMTPDAARLAGMPERPMLMMAALRSMKDTPASFAMGAAVAMMRDRASQSMRLWPTVVMSVSVTELTSLPAMPHAFIAVTTVFVTSARSECVTVAAWAADSWMR